jgi:protocatechuate 3,4-dioxygenase beta subunit
MKRQDFLKTLGVAGLSSVSPLRGGAENTKTPATPKGNPPNCTLIPTETAGPFPWDLTANNAFFRQDVRENQQGVQLNLKLKIIGNSNCLPMQNVRVNIWHCNKDGLYSAYSSNNNQGQAGLTYLRGWQMTDANGEVEFVTIFPGWYTGRICHIHFQVYVSSVYAAISQLTFDIPTKNAIYSANSGIYTKGADPLSYSSDNIFSDGYAYQLASLTPNAATGGYSSYLEVTVQGSGVSGLLNAAPETGGQFTLGQNFPNPYSEQTRIPFTLTNKGRAVLTLHDLSGRQVAVLLDKPLEAGDHQAIFEPKNYGLPAGTYAYQLEVQNTSGVFRQGKIMTVGR